MTKLRSPGSIEHAVWTVGQALGWPEAARLVGQSRRQLYTWADPDDATLPPMRAALLLDAAYSDATGQGWPISDAYALKVACARASGPCTPELLHRRIGAVIREGSEAHGSLIDLLAPGATLADTHDAIDELVDAAGAIACALPRLVQRIQAPP